MSVIDVNNPFILRSVRKGMNYGEFGSARLQVQRNPGGACLWLPIKQGGYRVTLLKLFSRGNIFWKGANTLFQIGFKKL